jgi:hypothetical protein
VKYKVKEASMEDLISKIPAIMNSKFVEVKDAGDYKYIVLRLVVEEVQNENNT